MPCELTNYLITVIEGHHPKLNWSLAGISRTGAPTPNSHLQREAL